MTVLPVLVDPEETQHQTMTEEEIQTSKLFTLGGNHIVNAARQLIEEDFVYGDILRKVTVVAYKDLTVSEALNIGNSHNRQFCQKDLTFQDKVMQARMVKREGEEVTPKDVASILGALQMRDIKPTSVSTICKVANFDETTYNKTKQLFFEYGTESIPVEFFRALQGLHTDTVNKYIEEALKEPQEVKKLAKKITKKKKEAIIHDIFTQETGCTNFTEASEIYPDHASQLDKFQDFNPNSKYISKELIQHCQDAVSGASASNKIDIQINICINGVRLNEDVEDVKKLKEKFVKKMLKEIKKLKLDTSIREVTCIPETQLSSQ